MLVAVLGTRYPDFAVERSIFGPDVTIVDGTPKTAAGVGELAGDADVIIAGTGTVFDAAAIAELSAKAIVRAGIGVDTVDLAAAIANGMIVSNVPDYGTDAVALHTVALALHAERRIGNADRTVRSGGWGFADVRPLFLPGSRTVGVVGFGRIGQSVSAKLAALGYTNQRIHDAYAPPTDDRAASLDEVLGADIITLHAPAPQDGSALIGPEQIALMPENAVLVNTARGALIDPNALAAGLAAGRPAYACLDVFSPEPADLTPFAEVMDQMTLTPHMAWYTEESQVDLRRKAAEEAKRILLGEGPQNAVAQPEESQ